MKRVLLILLAALTVFSITPIIENAAPASFVSVAQAASKVKLNKTDLLLAKGEDYKLKLKGTKKAAVWSTSNKNVATVKNGRITAKKTGNAVITAKVGSKKYKCKVTVFKRNKEGGEWKCNINGEEWIFSVSEYTSEIRADKPYGVICITRNSKPGSDLLYEEYKRIGANKYRCSYQDGVIDFTVYAKKIVVEHSGNIDGENISATFTLDHRYMAG